MSVFPVGVAASMLRHASWVTLTATMLIVLQGCGSSLRGIAQSRITPLSTLSQGHWTPGEKLAASPKETAKKDLCLSAQPGERVFLEEAEVAPSAISSGEQLYHRLRYVVCPAAAVRSVSGKIIRTVRLRKVTIFTDVTEHVFKPGSWVVDAAVVVPEEARSGEYAFEVALKTGKSIVRKRSTFFVTKSK